MLGKEQAGADGAAAAGLLWPQRGPFAGMEGPRCPGLCGTARAAPPPAQAEPPRNGSPALARASPRGAAGDDVCVIQVETFFSCQ